ncbi:hypothetical protein [Pseudomonas corrugata]|uniref:hypothetical protein n=1 Tax=Pseudomonas corrugata TaxID=47879 RepID=UPI0020C7B60B|nr:hypothetical protein [Pseudomonas corrugata]
MDYPKSVPSAGLVNGKFVDENPVTGTPGSLIPAQWGNAVTEEVLNVITSGGLTPSESSNTQLLTAINAKITNAIPASPPDASVTQKGLVELATNAEAQSGTDALRAVTPAALASRTATESRSGMAAIATQLVVNGGVDDATIVSPKKLAQRLSVFLPIGYFSGLRMWNSPGAPATVINVDPGAAKSSDDLFDIVLPNNLAAGLLASGAWTSGSGNQKLDVGSRAANTWYHLFLIRKAADGVAELLFSLSATAPTLPAGYSGSRRIGSVKTDGNGNIVPFINVGRQFYFSTPIKDFVGSAPVSTTGTQGAVTLILSVPPGVRTKVMTHVAMSGTAGFAYMRPTDSSAVAMVLVAGTVSAWQAGIGGNTANVDYFAFPFECLTDTTAAVILQWIMASSDGTAYYAVSTLGYTEL